MRDPFDLSGDCAYTAITVDLPVSLPFCSVPEFTTPTMVEPVFALDLPDIAVPPACACFSLDVDTTVAYTVSPVPTFTARVTALTDCCFHEYELELDLGIPCMPLQGSVTGSAHYAVTAVPTLTMDITRIAGPSTCELGFSFDLEIPCMPLSVSATGTGAYTEIIKPVFSVNVERTAGPATCELAFSFDLQIPCMPLSVAATGTGVFTDILKPELGVNLERTAGPGTCELGFSFDLEIPCMPLSVAATGTGVYTDILKPELGVNLERTVGPGTCELGFSFDLQIPCMPLSVAATGTGVFTDILKPELGVNIVRSAGPTHCELGLSFDIEIPCLPVLFSVNPNIALTHIDNPIFSVGFSRYVGPATCQFNVSYDIEVPCIGFGVTQNGAIAMTYGVSQPEGDFVLTQPAGTCEVGLSYSLEIPCVGFALTVVVNPLEIVDGYGALEVTLYKEADTCAIALSMDLDIPCMPLAATGGTFDISLVDDIDDARLIVDLERIAGPAGTCILGLTADLDIPCMPLDVGSLDVEVAIVDDPDDAGLAIELQRINDAGSCYLAITADLDIPCMPLELIPVVATPAAFVDATWHRLAGPAGTCAMDFSINVDCGCPAISIGYGGMSMGSCAEATFAVAYEDSIGAGGTCFQNWDFSLVVPCTPCDVTALPFGSDTYPWATYYITGWMEVDDCVLNLGISTVAGAAAIAMDPTVETYFSGGGDIDMIGGVTANTNAWLFSPSVGGSPATIGILKDGWYRLHGSAVIRCQDSSALEGTGHIQIWVQAVTPAGISTGEQMLAEWSNIASWYTTSAGVQVGVSVSHTCLHYLSAGQSVSLYEWGDSTVTYKNAKLHAEWLHN